MLKGGKIKMMIIRNKNAFKFVFCVLHAEKIWRVKEFIEEENFNTSANTKNEKKTSHARACI
jgi:hypothetical protein